MPIFFLLFFFLTAWWIGCLCDTALLTDRGVAVGTRRDMSRKAATFYSAHTGLVGPGEDVGQGDQRRMPQGWGAGAGGASITVVLRSGR